MAPCIVGTLKVNSWHVGDSEDMCDCNAWFHRHKTWRPPRTNGHKQRACSTFDRPSILVRAKKRIFELPVWPYESAPTPITLAKGRAVASPRGDNPFPWFQRNSFVYPFCFASYGHVCKIVGWDVWYFSYLFRSKRVTCTIHRCVCIYV